MHLIKALVIVMAAMIVGGLGLVAWGLLRQADGLKRKAGKGETVELSLPLPEECRLAEIGADGAGRLFLRLDGLAARGCRQVLLLESASGRLVGRIQFPVEK
jgi:hypothetical protein